MNDCLQWVSPYDGAREECEEEGRAQMECYELMATGPFSHPIAPLEVQEVKELGVMVSLGRKERWGEYIFLKICSYFLFILLLIN